MELKGGAIFIRDGGPVHLVGGQVLFSTFKIGRPDDCSFSLGMGRVLFFPAEILLRCERICTNYSCEQVNLDLIQYHAGQVYILGRRHILFYE